MQVRFRVLGSLISALCLVVIGLTVLWVSSERELAALCPPTPLPSRMAEKTDPYMIQSRGLPADIFVNDGRSPPKTTIGVNLTNTPRVSETYPVLSPDEMQIAYIHGSEQGTAIWIMNRDGSNPHEVVAPPPLFGFEGVTWSHDSQQLVTYGASRFHDWTIFVFNRDGTGFREVIKMMGDEWAITPNWSPDGTQLVFVGVRDRQLSLNARQGQYRLYTVPVSGGRLNWVGENSVSPMHYPSFSVDGRAVRYFSSDVNGHYVENVISLDQSKRAICSRYTYEEFSP